MNLQKKIILLIIPIILAVSIPLGATAGQPLKFSDVKDGDWYKPYVDVMSGKGICEGYGNGKYGPRDSIQVDQLIKLVVVAMGYKPGTSTAGKDWAATYINKAKTLGLVRDGEFTDYGRKITRGEIARIIARGMKETFPENLNAYQSLIKDFGSIGTGDREYILKVYCKGIVGGYTDGRFGAADNATRGEASKMIVNLIDPSARTIPALTDTETKVIRGYTIPTTHTTTIVTDSSLCDLHLSIRFNYPLEVQYDEVKIILVSKFGSELTDKIMEYVKLKNVVDYKLDSKTFKAEGYEIIVKGGGWTITILVYKK